MEEKISFNLNGKATEITIDPTLTLLWVLRDQFGLTGTKYGCGIGFCGACTILLDNEAVRSCMMPAGDVQGRRVVTIEGLAVNGQLHPLQIAFIEKDALQCGYCTPGMIMNAYGLLLKNPEPTRAEVIEGMQENLCRCGAHIRIIEAIQMAGREMKGALKT
ncbi:MAG: (2Fe-2S)-binding protein [Bacteroidetes bacterium]|nr:MAG: (2Fe-2S)-binding protein [Bacteroidota bacterium]